MTTKEVLSSSLGAHLSYLTMKWESGVFMRLEKRNSICRGASDTHTCPAKTSGCNAIGGKNQKMQTLISKSCASSTREFISRLKV